MSANYLTTWTFSDKELIIEVVMPPSSQYSRNDSGEYFIYFYFIYVGEQSNKIIIYVS